MTKHHPYPEHVVEAVAEAMGKSRTGEDWGRFQEYFIEHTHVALQALWDASRVDTVEQLDALPDEAVINDGYFTQTKDVNQWTGGFHQFANNDQIDLPVHVIYWGDSDE